MKPESDVSANRDHMGDLRIGYKLTQEDVESLRALRTSPHWGTYRKLLLSALNEFTRASWRVRSMDDAVQSIHHSGMAAGLNFAINQADVLVADFDARREKVIEKKTEKEKTVFVRG